MTTEGLSRAADKSDPVFDRMVAEGQAMNRLLLNDDFKVYQGLMRQEFDFITRKICACMPEHLPALQGALIQQNRVMGLAEKAVARATKIMDEKRAEGD